MIYNDYQNFLKRESDGACIPKSPGNRDYQEALEKGTIQPAPVVDPAPARIAAAWTAADALARAAIDENARARFTLWLIDPASSTAKKAAIGACVAWMDQIWYAYATVKAQIAAGQDAKFEFSTPCPYTFWDIAAL